MRVVQIAGTSGAGKSTVFRRLRALGHQAVSTDSTDGLCRWVDAAGTPVSRPESPSLAWLDAHRWAWDLSCFDALVRSWSGSVGDATVYVCGGAANDDHVRFDAIVLLDIDEPTMLSRVLDPARSNDFGRCGDSLASLVAGLSRLRSHYLDRGAVAVDATAPLSTVVDSVLASVRPPLRRARRSAV